MGYGMFLWDVPDPLAGAYGQFLAEKRSLARDPFKVVKTWSLLELQDPSLSRPGVVVPSNLHHVCLRVKAKSQRNLNKKTMEFSGLTVFFVEPETSELGDVQKSRQACAGKKATEIGKMAGREPAGSQGFLPFFLTKEYRNFFFLKNADS